jgi:aldehyde dehydrogenase (NAD+)
VRGPSTCAIPTTASSSEPCRRPPSRTSAARSPIAKSYKATLTRHDRYRILYRAAEIIRSRTDEISDLITAECGICKKDSLYEVGRACDVFVFAGNAALNDDGQIFSCDLTPHGKKRKVYTLREPLLGAISAITPFNHPLNQVAHKVAPVDRDQQPDGAEAHGEDAAHRPAPRRHPLRGGPAAPDVLGRHGRSARNRRRDADQSGHGSRHLHRRRSVGKYIAAKAVYKRQVLELGGNDPIIVMEDANVEEAAALAAAGSYKNSGQRCTAVKRMLVHEAVADRFVELLLALTQKWTYGDPMDPHVDMGHRHRRRPRRNRSKRK